MPDQQAPKRTIQIEEYPNGSFTVRIGELYCDKMDSGECLWFIANLFIHRNSRLPFGGLRTKEEHDRRDRELRGEPPKLEPHQRLLPPHTSEFVSI